MSNTRRTALLNALDELGGAALASQLAKRAVEDLNKSGQHIAYNDMRAEIWLMVDEKQIDWRPDRKISSRRGSNGVPSR